jgi:signal transduction histidine kinase
VGNTEGLFKYHPESDRFQPDSTLGDEFATGERGMWNMTKDAEGRVWFNSRYAKGASVTPGEEGSYQLNYPLLRVSNATFLCFFPEENGDVLWAGAEDGRLIRYDNTYELPDTVIYKAIVRKVIARQDSVLLDGSKPLLWTPPRLPYEFNSLRFYFTIPRYDAPEAKRYQYRLVGLTDEWSEWTDETYRDFNSLPEGRYRFEVRGYDVYYFTSQIGSFEFVVLPPWYRTWWAYSLYIIGFGALLYGAYKWRVRAIEAYNRQLEDMIERRTRQLAEANQEIQTYNERLEQMLEDRTRHLIISERQAVFGQLVQGIVHNLKNPLSASTMSTGAIREALRVVENADQSSPEDVKKANDRLVRSVKQSVGWIERANQNLNDMITSLLTKSRSDKAADRARIDLNDLLRNEVEFLQADKRFKKMKRKKIRLADEPLPVEVVPGEMAQVFQNIVGNALEAMYDTPDPFLAVETFERDGHAVMIISDSGPGIPEEIRQKVFDPFFSTKSPLLDEEAGEDEPKGTGLGLWMCRQAVESFGGVIQLETEEGKGTSFRIALPLAR